MGDQVKYTRKLENAKVLIIGGSSGIGYGVAEALVENGCYVVISSSNQNRINQKTEQLKTAYPSAASRISGFVCDLGNELSLESNIADLFKHCGSLDHIIYTAGDRLAQTKLADVSFDAIKQAGLVRYFGAILVAKHGVKYLKGGPTSSLTITGAVSERPRPDWVLVNGYSTGLQGVTKALALDMKPIRVNLVAPGAVDTELWGTFGLSDKQREDMMEGLSKRLPTGHVGTAEEIAEAYLYVLKDTNITGSMISTNGGVLLI